jgi:hypothetical protein
MPVGALEILAGDRELATVAPLATEPEHPYLALIEDVLDRAGRAGSQPSGGLPAVAFITGDLNRQGVDRRVRDLDVDPIGIVENEVRDGQADQARQDNGEPVATESRPQPMMPRGASRLCDRRSHVRRRWPNRDRPRLMVRMRQAHDVGVFIEGLLH